MNDILIDRINKQEYYSSLSSLAAYYYSDTLSLNDMQNKFYQPKFIGINNPINHPSHYASTIDAQNSLKSFHEKTEHVLGLIAIYGKIFTQIQDLNKKKAAM